VPKDFERFSLIVAMDHQNLQDLEALRPLSPPPSTPLARRRSWDPEAAGDLDVPDPYYGGPDGFEAVFRMVERSCASLLDSLLPPR
jgi:protein-tyrosine phosphatase